MLTTATRTRRLIVLLVTAATLVLTVGASPTPAAAGDPELATITGRVTADANGQPIAGIGVYLSWIPAGGGIWLADSSVTDANGDYELTLFDNGGTYVVQFADDPDDPVYMSEWWNDAPLAADADNVPVTAGQNTPNINASLAPDRQPDGWVRKGAAGANAGNNIYNTRGEDQTRSASVPRGGSVSYFVTAQNDGRVPEVFRLKGTPTNSDFRVRYTDGGVDVTPQVVAGTYLTPQLPIGGTHVVKVTVTARSAAASGDRLTVNVTSKSNTQPAQRDTVKAITSRT